MSHFLQTSFLPSPSVSLRRNTQSYIPGFRVNTRINPVQAKIREIFIPALSSTMTEGKIVSWVKAEGGKLSKGESVVVVESDKADMDVETFHDGYLAAIMVEEGGVAPVGSAIALLTETEDEIAEAKSKANSPSPSSPAPSPAPATSSSSAEAVAPVVPPKDEKKIAVAAAAAAGSAVHPASEGGRRVVASPYAKKLAKELKVELASIVGSGPMGRIVGKDVEAAAAPAVTKLEEEILGAAATAVAPSSGIELGAVVPFTTMQNAVSRNMVESLTVPTFRVGYTITTDALDALYKKIKSKGVTMPALLAKATALALVKHPVVNSSCRDGNSFTYNSGINIAVAVAMDGGLITPVLQDADKASSLTSLVNLNTPTHMTCAIKVKIGFVYAFDFEMPLMKKVVVVASIVISKTIVSVKKSNGTFTLSNLGMFGVDRFDAILPPGTGAIMAVGASQPTVVATKDGRLGMKNQMQVNVTADHRVIYGADLAQFLQTLAKIIEDPKDLTL